MQYTDYRDSKFFTIVIAIVDFYHAMITIDTITSPTVQGKVCFACIPGKHGLVHGNVRIHAFYHLPSISITADCIKCNRLSWSWR